MQAIICQHGSGIDFLGGMDTAPDSRLCIGLQTDRPLFAEVMCALGLAHPYMLTCGLRVVFA